MESEDIGKLKERIKELEKENARLKETEKKYSDLFEKAPVGIFRTSSEGETLMLNGTMAHILGCQTPDEAIEYYDPLAEWLYFDPTSLEFLKEVLEPMGAELILKQSGEEGYQAFRNNTDIDLILMDIRLPDTSGMEIIKRIRESNHQVKIIAQTAHAMGDDRSLCLQAEADDYITKPIKIDDLLRMIHQYL